MRPIDAAVIEDVDFGPEAIAKALRCPDSFGWFGDPKVFTTWALGAVIRTRDSTLIDQSNAAVLKERIKAAEVAGLIEPESWEIVTASHWACGWVEHCSYRVVGDDGEATRTARWLRAWFDYLRNDYPVADESDYSERQAEATLEGIRMAADCRALRNLTPDAGWPDGWVWEVLHWFDEHDSSALEDRDDTGAYPSEEQMLAAFRGLGYVTDGTGYITEDE